MISPGVVAAIHVAGVRCGPCGAVHHKGHHVHHVRSKYVGVLLCIFMHFNIEISILD